MFLYLIAYEAHIRSTCSFHSHETRTTPNRQSRRHIHWAGKLEAGNLKTHGLVLAASAAQVAGHARHVLRPDAQHLIAVQLARNDKW